MPVLRSNLAKLRKVKKMSQEELGRIVGVRRETISLLEKGKYNPSLKLAMDVVKVFGKSVEEVFQFEEDEK